MTLSSDVLEWRGRALVDVQGVKVGTIEEIYLDEQTSQPEWALVRTGLFGTRSTFVPIGQAENNGDDVRVPFATDLIKDAPNIDADARLTVGEEARLFGHYGLGYGTDTAGQEISEVGWEKGGADTGTITGSGQTGDDTSGPTTDEAMTRSEEELRVGTVRQEAGRARLRKYVVTEEQQVTVPVQREEVRIEREPITDAEQQTVTDEVRTEQIEVEDDSRRR
jgi:stress response protein YsnF/sporulation protein YlmC with PRC-barrel domain